MRKVLDMQIITADNEKFFTSQIVKLLNNGYEPYRGEVTTLRNMNYVTAVIKYEPIKEPKIKKEEKVMI